MSRWARMLTVVLLGTAVLSVGCEKEGPEADDRPALRTRIAELEQAVRVTEGELQKWKLKAETAERNNPEAALKALIEKHAWLEKLRRPGYSWDKMTVARYEGDPEEKAIEDPLFVRSAGDLFFIRSLYTDGYPNGYQSDVGSFYIKLYEGDRFYAVTVVGRGVMEAGGHEAYFRIAPDAHMIGNALLPKPSYIRHDGLMAKMANSGAVKRGAEYVMISAFRVQSRVYFLGSDASTRLAGEPVSVGERVERFTFYYYGKELWMDVYADHVRLSGEGEEEWYHVPEAGVQLTSEPG